MKKLFGVVAPIITPVKEDGEIDDASLEKLSLSLIERGCDGLYVCGTTGGVTYFNTEERKHILETVWKAANGKALVYAQTGGTILRDTLELTQHALDLGVDGLGILTPTYFKLRDEELENYYVTVAKTVPADVPIYLYAIPDFACNDLSLSLVTKLADQCENIVGIKYSSGDYGRICQFKQIRDGKFSVLVSSPAVAHSAFSIGCDGIISGACILFTEEVKALYQAYQNGDMEKVIRLQRDMYRWLAYSWPEEMAKCTAFAYHEGVISSDTMRAPLMQLNSEEKESFLNVMEEYKKNLVSLQ